MTKLAGRAETSGGLAYWLYSLCEHEKCTAEALPYDQLVQSCLESFRLAREGRKPRSALGGLFDEMVESSSGVSKVSDDDDSS